MSDQTPYSIHLDEAFGPLALIDIPKLVNECREQWHNQTLCRVDECVVRLAIVKGEFHWHKHASEDEFFLVLEGKLLVDLEDQTVELGPHQAYSVPKGIMHRTRARERTVVIAIERAGVNPIGDQE